MKRLTLLVTVLVATVLMACRQPAEDAAAVAEVAGGTSIGAAACPVADAAGHVDIAAGLTATILIQGHGRPAAIGDTADVNASLWLYDEAADDNKGNFIWESGAQPFSFELGASGLIRGWNMGVECMLVGEKRDLVIASELAYGESGRAPMVPPNAALFYTLELVSLSAAE
jgi:FKBP-type peptidyl-prolyl cis-trans isomerase